jgi:hypothetical protein
LATPELVSLFLAPGFVLLSGFAFWAAWQRREERWVHACAVALFVVPPITVFLAPAIAVHGSLYRSGVALLPIHSALVAFGLVAIGRVAVERDYPRHLAEGILLLCYAAIVFSRVVPAVRGEAPPAECDIVAELPADAVVFTSEPLELERRCGRAGVMITRSVTPRMAVKVAERYGVVLSGWRQVEPNLWAAP